MKQFKYCIALGFALTVSGLFAQEFSETLKLESGEKLSAASVYGQSGCAVLTGLDSKVKLYLFNNGLKDYKEVNVNAVITLGSMVATGPASPYVYVMTSQHHRPTLPDYEWNVVRVDSAGNKTSVGKIYEDPYPFFSTNIILVGRDAFYYVYWDWDRKAKTNYFYVKRIAHNENKAKEYTIEIPAEQYSDATCIGIKGDELIFTDNKTKGEQLVTTIHFFDAQGDETSAFHFESKNVKMLSPTHTMRETFGGTYRDNSWYYHSGRKGIGPPNATLGSVSQVLQDPFGNGFYCFLLYQEKSVNAGGAHGTSAVTDYVVSYYNNDGKLQWTRKEKVPSVIAENSTFGKMHFSADRIVRIVPLDSSSLRIVFFDANNANAIYFHQRKAGSAGDVKANVKKDNFATYEQMEPIISIYTAPGESLKDAEDYLAGFNDKFGNRQMIYGLSYGQDSEGYVLYSSKNNTIDIKIYGNGFHTIPYSR